MTHAVMVPVKSSNIKEVGWGPKGLSVHFHGGRIYHYPTAPKSLFDEAMAAESVGKWFRSNVAGKFDHAKPDAG